MLGFNLHLPLFAFTYFSRVSGRDGCSTFLAIWTSRVLRKCHALWRVEASQASEGQGYLVTLWAVGVYYLTTLGCHPASRRHLLFFSGSWPSENLFHFRGHLISCSFRSILSQSSQILTLQHWTSDYTQHSTYPSRGDDLRHICLSCTGNSIVFLHPALSPLAFLLWDKHTSTQKSLEKFFEILSFLAYSRLTHSELRIPNLNYFQEASNWQMEQWLKPFN